MSVFFILLIIGFFSFIVIKTHPSITGYVVYSAASFIPTAAFDSSLNNQISPNGGTVDVSDNTAVTLTFGGISYVTVTNWSDTVADTANITMVNLTCEIDSVMGRGENLSFYYNISGPWVYACGGAIAGAGSYSCDLYASGINTYAAVNNMDVRCSVFDTNGGTSASLTLDAIRLFVNLTIPSGNTTGAVGTTSFTITPNIIVNLNDSAINLGTLTQGKNISSENVSDWFVIVNDGSVLFDVYAYGAASSDSIFTSATNGANKIPNNYYLVHANNSLSGAANTTYRQIPATAANRTSLVKSLDYKNGIDRANIGILVSVPADEPAGGKSAALTLYAEAS